jgi:hypothetical protein
MRQKEACALKFHLDIFARFACPRDSSGLQQQKGFSLELCFRGIKKLSFGSG